MQLRNFFMSVFLFISFITLNAQVTNWGGLSVSGSTVNINTGDVLLLRPSLTSGGFGGVRVIPDDINTIGAQALSVFNAGGNYYVKANSLRGIADNKTIPSDTGIWIQATGNGIPEYNFNGLTEAQKNALRTSSGSSILRIRLDTILSPFSDNNNNKLRIQPGGTFHLNNFTKARTSTASVYRNGVNRLSTSFNWENYTANVPYITAPSFRLEGAQGEFRNDLFTGFDRAVRNNTSYRIDENIAASFNILLVDDNNLVRSSKLGSVHFLANPEYKNTGPLVIEIGADPVTYSNSYWSRRVPAANKNGYVDESPTINTMNNPWGTYIDGNITNSSFSNVTGKAAITLNMQLSWPETDYAPAHTRTLPVQVVQSSKPNRSTYTFEIISGDLICGGSDVYLRVVDSNNIVAKEIKQKETSGYVISNVVNIIDGGTVSNNGPTHRMILNESITNVNGLRPTIQIEFGESDYNRKQTFERVLQFGKGNLYMGVTESFGVTLPSSGSKNVTFNADNNSPVYFVNASKGTRITNTNTISTSGMVNFTMSGGNAGTGITYHDWTNTGTGAPYARFQNYSSGPAWINFNYHGTLCFNGAGSGTVGFLIYAYGTTLNAPWANTNDVSLPYGTQEIDLKSYLKEEFRTFTRMNFKIVNPTKNGEEWVKIVDNKLVIIPGPNSTGRVLVEVVPIGNEVAVAASSRFKTFVITPLSIPLKTVDPVDERYLDLENFQTTYTLNSVTRIFPNEFEMPYDASYYTRNNIQKSVEDVNSLNYSFYFGGTVQHDNEMMKEIHFNYLYPSINFGANSLVGRAFTSSSTEYGYDDIIIEKGSSPIDILGDTYTKGGVSSMITILNNNYRDLISLTNSSVYRQGRLENVVGLSGGSLDLELLWETDNGVEKQIIKLIIIDNEKNVPVLNFNIIDGSLICGGENIYVRIVDNEGKTPSLVTNSKTSNSVIESIERIYPGGTLVTEGEYTHIIKPSLGPTDYNQNGYLTGKIKIIFDETEESEYKEFILDIPFEKNNLVFTQLINKINVGTSAYLSATNNNRIYQIFNENGRLITSEQQWLDNNDNFEHELIGSINSNSISQNYFGATTNSPYFSSSISQSINGLVQYTGNACYNGQELEFEISVEPLSNNNSNPRSSSTKTIIYGDSEIDLFNDGWLYSSYRGNIGINIVGGPSDALKLRGDDNEILYMDPNNIVEGSYVIELTNLVGEPFSVSNRFINVTVNKKTEFVQSNMDIPESLFVLEDFRVRDFRDRLIPDEYLMPYDENYYIRNLISNPVLTIDDLGVEYLLGSKGISTQMTNGVEYEIPTRKIFIKSQFNNIKFTSNELDESVGSVIEDDSVKIVKTPIFTNTTRELIFGNNSINLIGDGWVTGGLSDGIVFEVLNGGDGIKLRGERNHILYIDPKVNAIGSYTIKAISTNPKIKIPEENSLLSVIVKPLIFTLDIQNDIISNSLNISDFRTKLNGRVFPDEFLLPYNENYYSDNNLGSALEVSDLNIKYNLGTALSTSEVIGGVTVRYDRRPINISYNGGNIIFKSIDGARVGGIVATEAKKYIENNVYSGYANTKEIIYGDNEINIFNTTWLLDYFKGKVRFNIVNGGEKIGLRGDFNEILYIKPGNSAIGSAVIEVIPVDDNIVIQGVNRLNITIKRLVRSLVVQPNIYEKDFDLNTFRTTLTLNNTSYIVPEEFPMPYDIDYYNRNGISGSPETWQDLNIRYYLGDTYITSNNDKINPIFVMSDYGPITVTSGSAGRVGGVMYEENYNSELVNLYDDIVLIAGSGNSVSLTQALYRRDTTNPTFTILTPNWREFIETTSTHTSFIRVSSINSIRGIKPGEVEVELFWQSSGSLPIQRQIIKIIVLPMEKLDRNINYEVIKGDLVCGGEDVYIRIVDEDGNVPNTVSIASTSSVVTAVSSLGAGSKVPEGVGTHSLVISDAGNSYKNLDVRLKYVYNETDTHARVVGELSIPFSKGDIDVLNNESVLRINSQGYWSGNKTSTGRIVDIININKNVPIENASDIAITNGAWELHSINNQHPYSFNELTLVDWNSDTPSIKGVVEGDYLVKYSYKGNYCFNSFGEKELLVKIRDSEIITDNIFLKTSETINYGSNEVNMFDMLWINEKYKGAIESFYIVSGSDKVGLRGEQNEVLYIIPGGNSVGSATIGFKLKEGYTINADKTRISITIKQLEVTTRERTTRVPYLDDIVLDNYLTTYSYGNYDDVFEDMFVMPYNNDYYVRNNISGPENTIDDLGIIKYIGSTKIESVNGKSQLVANVLMSYDYPSIKFSKLVLGRVIVNNPIEYDVLPEKVVKIGEGTVTLTTLYKDEYSRATGSSSQTGTINIINEDSYKYFSTDGLPLAVGELDVEIYWSARNYGGVNYPEKYSRGKLRIEESDKLGRIVNFEVLDSIYCGTDIVRLSIYDNDGVVPESVTIKKSFNGKSEWLLNSISNIVSKGTVVEPGTPTHYVKLRELSNDLEIQGYVEVKYNHNEIYREFKQEFGVAGERVNVIIQPLSNILASTKTNSYSGEDTVRVTSNQIVPSITIQNDLTKKYLTTNSLFSNGVTFALKSVNAYQTNSDVAIDSNSIVTSGFGTLNKTVPSITSTKEQGAIIRFDYLGNNCFYPVNDIELDIRFKAEATMYNDENSSWPYGDLDIEMVYGDKPIDLSNKFANQLSYRLNFEIVGDTDGRLKIADDRKTLYIVPGVEKMQTEYNVIVRFNDENTIVPSNNIFKVTVNPLYYEVSKDVDFYYNEDDEMFVYGKYRTRKLVLNNGEYVVDSKEGEETGEYIADVKDAYDSFYMRSYNLGNVEQGSVGIEVRPEEAMGTEDKTLYPVYGTSSNANIIVGDSNNRRKLFDININDSTRLDYEASIQDYTVLKSGGRTTLTVSVINPNGLGPTSAGIESGDRSNYEISLKNGFLSIDIDPVVAGETHFYTYIPADTMYKSKKVTFKINVVDDSNEYTWGNILNNNLEVGKLETLNYSLNDYKLRVIGNRGIYNQTVGVGSTEIVFSETGDYIVEIENLINNKFNYEVISVGRGVVEPWIDTVDIPFIKILGENNTMFVPLNKWLWKNNELGGVDDVIVDVIDVRGVSSYEIKGDAVDMVGFNGIIELDIVIKEEVGSRWKALPYTVYINPIESASYWEVSNNLVTYDIVYGSDDNPVNINSILVGRVGYVEPTIRVKSNVGAEGISVINNKLVINYDVVNAGKYDIIAYIDGSGATRSSDIIIQVNILKLGIEIADTDEIFDIKSQEPNYNHLEYFTTYNSGSVSGKVIDNLDLGSLHINLNVNPQISELELGRNVLNVSSSNPNVIINNDNLALTLIRSLEESILNISGDSSVNLGSNLNLTVTSNNPGTLYISSDKLLVTNNVVQITNSTNVSLKAMSGGNGMVNILFVPLNTDIYAGTSKTYSVNVSSGVIEDPENWSDSYTLYCNESILLPAVNKMNKSIKYEIISGNGIVVGNKVTVGSNDLTIKAFSEQTEDVSEWEGTINISVLKRARESFTSYIFVTDELNIIELGEDIGSINITGDVLGEVTRGSNITLALNGSNGIMRIIIEDEGNNCYNSSSREFIIIKQDYNIEMELENDYISGGGETANVTIYVKKQELIPGVIRLQIYDVDTNEIKHDIIIEDGDWIGSGEKKVFEIVEEITKPGKTRLKGVYEIR